MKFLGLFLLMTGITIIFYSMLFGSSNSTFWPMYIGFTMVISGLGILGFNIGGHPF